MSLELQLLAFVLVVSVSIQSGDSLTCYQCRSPLRGDCDTPINLTKVNTQKCTGHENACLLLNETRNGFTEITRECAHINYCSQPMRRKRQASSFARSCNTCSWSYCNSAQKIAPTFAAAVGGLVFLKHYL